MNVLVIDIGGTNIKLMVSGQKLKRDLATGPSFTPRTMVKAVRKLTADWKYDVISIGFPGLVHLDKPVAEPWNLGPGWVGFNFKTAFRRPVKVINDAAMQALGSYRRGKMLFLGFGTGLGTALVVNGMVEPMELGHLPYVKSTFEDYLGRRGLEKFGKKRWRKYVDDAVRRLIAAVGPDEVVLGGGNAKKIKTLPPRCRIGDNSKAFLGGYRLWKRNATLKDFQRPRRGTRRPGRIQTNNKRVKGMK